MSDTEDKEDKRGFKIDDRRRFSDTGEARAGAPEEKPETAPPFPATDSKPSTESAAPSRADAPIEINFSTFMISLSTQALAYLGEIPNPIDNRTELDLSAAKQMIDILGILKDKTRGNLDKSEAALLDSVLYDLRLKYVERVRGHS